MFGSNEKDLLMELEISEMKAEIARHHRDFAKISELVNHALDNWFTSGLPTPGDTLKEIRKIVG